IVLAQCSKVPIMNFIRTGALAGLALGLSLTSAAAATSASVSITLSERAGPSIYYPVVAVVPRGAPVTIYGCLVRGSWCDVSYAGARGWLPGAYLEVYYRTRTVFLPAYVTVIAVPIVIFDFDTYWQTYYRDRPFYAERIRYMRYAPGPGARIAVRSRHEPTATRFAAVQVKPYGALKRKAAHI